MRVVQINSVYRNGSTGRTTFEVEKALIENGDESFVAYGYGKESSHSNAYRINTKFTNDLHKVLARITGRHSYYSYFSTRKMIKQIQKFEPDLIHIRCLHGDYINLPLLMEYLSKFDGPVFANLHDCWDFTGHCPYFGKCEKWMSECKGCDKLKEYPKSLFFDTSRRNYQDKKKWFSNIKDLHVVGVSKWMKELAEKSILSEAKEITYLYNWIDQEMFSPKLRTAGADDNFTVVFVSASWIPGTYRYNILQKLIGMLDETISIKIAGIYPGEKVEKNNVEYLGYVSSPAELAKLYANSNVYVHLSIEEAFGKVIAEANACGIPGIVFDTTGCAEVVSSTSGYKVPVDDVDEIVAKIEEIKKNGYVFYKDAAVENVSVNFNYSTNVAQLLDMYKNALSNHRNEGNANERNCDK